MSYASGKARGSNIFVLSGENGIITGYVYTVFSETTIDITAAGTTAFRVTGVDGYFGGQMSAETVIDRTPAPKDTKAAYKAMKSMKTKPAVYQVMTNITPASATNEEIIVISANLVTPASLDDAALDPIFRGKDGGRNLSMVVSALMKIANDLNERVEELEENP